MGTYAEMRGLGELTWLRPEDIQTELKAFLPVLEKLGKERNVLGQYARGAKPILKMWAKPGMIRLDYDNPGYLELDDQLSLAINPLRIIPWWVSRRPGWGPYRGEELHRAFLRFMVGLVHHDITHMMVWIAHRRLPAMHTLYLGEELNCTLWGTTIAHIAVTGQILDIEDPKVADEVVEAAQPPIFSVHVRDYLADRKLVLSSGPAMDYIFGTAAPGLELMKKATEMVPEHPGAYRAYERFAAWTLANRGDPLDGGEILKWRGHEGFSKLPRLAS